MSKAQEFFFTKFKLSGLNGETKFQDAARLLLRRHGIKCFNLDSLTEKEETVLLQEFLLMTKEGLEELIGAKDVTINIFNTELR